jgi:hypothetical protein
MENFPPYSDDTKGYGGSAENRNRGTADRSLESWRYIPAPHLLCAPCLIPAGEHESHSDEFMRF